MRINEACKFIGIQTDFPDSYGSGATFNVRKNAVATDLLSSVLTLNATYKNSGVTIVNAQRDLVRGDRLNLRLVAASDDTIKNGGVYFLFIKGV